MFCNQCEQTAQGRGCTRSGVCGKSAEAADIQDQIISALRGLAQTALAARNKGIVDAAADRFSARALFSTLTNVNFDPAALRHICEEAQCHAADLAARIGAAPAPTNISSAMDAPAADPDVRSAMQILLYGLKGMAAYADHAVMLDQEDPELFAFIHEGLAAGADGKPRDLSAWLELILRCGKANLRAMELLDAGNTGAFGNPVPTRVSLGHRKGKAILISGHDLADLRVLLEQTQDTGIQVYTHGEMLPAHGYPGLHRFSHLAGHYGTAWQNQRRELPGFPGPVLFTTNCLQNPQGYDDKVFSTGNVGWPGVKHCPNRDGRRDFSALISKALELPGFAGDEPGPAVATGFGRKTLLDAAPAVIDAIKSGAVRHIFLVGGCDGAKPGRNYYTEFVEKTPPDTLVLTLGCGKFRFFDKEFGTIGGFPRLMDVGQCNDAFAAVKTALALAEALGCTVNDLPLSLVLSWYEQKAVSILLTLLALGVKNIRLGPTLPAFVSPGVLNALIRQWNLGPISTPEEDLKAILQK